MSTTPKPRRNRGGRPRLDPAGPARVVLPAQRIRPDTLAYLAQHNKGIGQAIDAAVSAQIVLHRELRARLALTPRP